MDDYELTCYWCGQIRYRTHIRFVDDRPLCAAYLSTCKKEYYNATHPEPADRRAGVPRTVGYYDKG